MDNYIQKDDFDWEYYLQKNEDIKRAGNTTLDKCYRHWITYGCYENRWVRSLSKLQELQVKLKTGEKFACCVVPQRTIGATGPIGPRIIDLKFKIAIMVHIFDVHLINCFVRYINSLNDKYVPSNFDVYINIVEEDNPYKENLRSYVTEQISHINNKSISHFYSKNKGGDIGGFLLLSKIVVSSNTDYRYVIFVHSKNKSTWRKDLCRAIFDIDFETLPKNPKTGIVSAKKWIYEFNPVKIPDEYKKYKYHLIDLYKIYELTGETQIPQIQSLPTVPVLPVVPAMWSFIAGTMFLTDISIIKYIVSHEVNRVYDMLNSLNSVDINWVYVMNSLGKDTLGTTNDYQYRLKYGKSLLSDYMIEHTYERIIGLICNHLDLKIMGV